MAVLKTSYIAPRFFEGGHVQTLYPYLLRTVSGVQYVRERIATPDGDFLDLDWQRRGSRRLVVVSHGLEGSSRQNYVCGMVKVFYEAGWDCLAWNYRSCSGELNLTARFYHSGATDDLECVLSHALASGSYDSVILIGFSLGANLSAKFVGERGESIDRRIKGLVAISCPFNLADCERKLRHYTNFLYQTNFLFTLKRKLLTKSRAMSLPHVSLRKAMLCRTLGQFDDLVTAPLHGFDSGMSYYLKASCGQFLASIAIPTLILNAENDPILPTNPIYTQLFQDHSYVHLEISPFGGHVGFIDSGMGDVYWSEKRALEFVSEICSTGGAC